MTVNDVRFTSDVDLIKYSDCPFPLLLQRSYTVSHPSSDIFADGKIRRIPADDKNFSVIDFLTCVPLCLTRIFTDQFDSTLR